MIIWFELLHLISEDLVSGIWWRRGSLSGWWSAEQVWSFFWSVILCSVWSAPPKVCFFHSSWRRSSSCYSEGHHPLNVKAAYWEKLQIAVFLPLSLKSVREDFPLWLSKLPAEPEQNPLDHIRTRFCPWSRAIGGVGLPLKEWRRLLSEVLVCRCVCVAEVGRKSLKQEVVVFLIGLVSCCGFSLLLSMSNRNSEVPECKNH